MITLDIHKQIQTVLGKENLEANITIHDNQTTAIYGDSGAGKTTLLRIIAGLTKPEKGTIIVNNQTWFSSEKKINLKTQNRNIGFVFQDYALFPNMTVRNNIAFALKDKNNISLVDQLLVETELTNLAHQYPSHLSGGQKQRVALARALALEPKILLMDEPLSALDIKTRIKLRALIKRLQSQYRITIVLVSHDIPEIFSLADRVIKLEDNQLQDSGTPEEAFDKELLKKQYGILYNL